MKKTKVFVYGILQTGSGTPATITGDLYQVASFPGVVRVDKELAGQVHGEILEVTSRELFEFDIIEGVPHHYDRVETTAQTADGPVKCYVYEYQLPVEGKTLILSGRWKDEYETLNG